MIIRRWSPRHCRYQSWSESDVFQGSSFQLQRPPCRTSVIQQRRAAVSDVRKRDPSMLSIRFATDANYSPPRSILKLALIIYQHYL